MNFKQQYESLHDNNGGVTGSIEYTVYCKGVPIEHVEEHNLVVMQGRHRLAELCAGDSNMCIKRIGVGIGTNPAAQEDSFLQDQYTCPLVGHTVSGADAIFAWKLTENEANGMNITEFGLFDGSSTPVMITHQVRGKVLAKDVDITIQGTYTLHF